MLHDNMTCTMRVYARGPRGHPPPVGQNKTLTIKQLDRLGRDISDSFLNAS